MNHFSLKVQLGQAIPWIGFLGHDSLMFLLLVWKVWSIKKHQADILLLDLIFRDGE